MLNADRRERERDLEKDGERVTREGERDPETDGERMAELLNI